MNPDEADISLINTNSIFDCFQLPHDINFTDDMLAMGAEKYVYLGFMSRLEIFTNYNISY